MKKLFFATLIAASFGTTAFAADCTAIHEKVVSDNINDAQKGFVFDVFETLSEIYAQTNQNIVESQMSKFVVSHEVVSEKTIPCLNKSTCLETFVKFTANDQAEINDGIDVRDFTLKFQAQPVEVVRYVTEIPSHQTTDPFGDASGDVCETKASSVTEFSNADLIYNKNNKTIGYVFFNYGPIDTKTPSTPAQ